MHALRRFCLEFFSSDCGLLAIPTHQIINISSVGGIWGQPFNDVYCASKFALEGLAESQAAVLREFGIYQTNVEPGAIRSSFKDNVKPGDMANMPKEYAHKKKTETCILACCVHFWIFFVFFRGGFKFRSRSHLGCRYGPLLQSTLAAYAASGAGASQSSQEVADVIMEKVRGFSVAGLCQQFLNKLYIVTLWDCSRSCLQRWWLSSSPRSDAPRILKSKGYSTCNLATQPESQGSLLPKHASFPPQQPRLLNPPPQRDLDRTGQSIQQGHLLFAAHRRLLPKGFSKNYSRNVLRFLNLIVLCWLRNWGQACPRHKLCLHWPRVACRRPF